MNYQSKKCLIFIYEFLIPREGPAPIVRKGVPRVSTLTGASLIPGKPRVSVLTHTTHEER